MKSFVKFDNDLFSKFSQKQVSLQAMGIFNYLALSVTYNSNTTDLSMNKLVSLAKCSKRVVARSIKELEEKGFLEVHKVPNKRQNFYTLNFIFKGVKDASTGTNTVPITGTGAVPHHTRVKLQFQKKENNKQEKVVVSFSKKVKPKIQAPLEKSEPKPKPISQFDIDPSSHFFQLHNTKTLSKFIKNYGSDFVDKTIRNLDIQYEKKPVREPVGLLFSALQAEFEFLDIQAKQQLENEKEAQTKQELEVFETQRRGEKKALEEKFEKQSKLIENVSETEKKKALKMVMLQFPKMKKSSPFFKACVEQKILEGRGS